MADLKNVEAELATRVRWVQAAAEPRRKGNPFWIESAWRDPALQVILRRRWEAALKSIGAPISGYSDAQRVKAMKIAPTAAKPNTSDHTKTPARAVDLGCDWEDNGLRDELVRDAGLEQKVPGEKWHLTLRPGRGPLPPLVIETQNVTAANVAEEEEDMPKNTDVMGSCSTPDGNGTIRVSWDGGVSQTGSATLYGSYGMLDAKDRNIPRNFRTVVWFQDGYKLIATTGEEYFFNPKTAEEFRAKGRL